MTQEVYPNWLDRSHKNGAFRGIASVNLIWAHKNLENQNVAMGLLSILLLFTFFPSTPVFGQTQVLNRGTELVIPLQAGPVGDPTDWGPAARDGDHGRVAVNDQGHILVAYHTTRDDLGYTTFDLKQVELAFFEYQSGSNPDRWSLEEQIIVGSVDFDPGGSSFQDEVKCERPAVTAVGSKFFVTWTRRYDYLADPGADQEEPAYLECAWVEWDGSNLLVHNGGLASGVGFPLASNYKVRECGGVPSIVNLNNATADIETVGIVFPDQEVFDYQVVGSVLREFDLNLVTCTLDNSPGMSNAVTSSGAPIILDDSVTVNGFTAPGMTNTAILVIPDLAPSSEENAFWLTYEEQFENPVTNDIVGRIHLDYWKFDGASWVAEMTRNIQAVMPANAVVKRRPKISSLPGDVAGVEEVTIVFNNLAATFTDPDVYYNEWGYRPVNGNSQQTLDPVGFNFTNTTTNENTPFAVHGPSGATIQDQLRRAYYELSGDGIEYYDHADDTDYDVSQSDTAVRPAATYSGFSGFSGSPTVAVTWEDLEFTSGGTDYLRVVLVVTN